MKILEKLVIIIFFANDMIVYMSNPQELAENN